MKRPLPPGIGTFAAGTVILLVAALLALRGREADRLERSFSALSLVSSLRQAATVAELDGARSDAILWSGFGGIRQRMAELERTWAEAGPDASSELRRLYVLENPFPEGERYRLTDPGDGSRYSAIHGEFHPRVGAFLAVHEYHDVLLVNPLGQVVYTSHKESDFGTDLREPPGRDTHLAEVVREVRALAAGATALSDFLPYEPSGNEWALFIGAPVALDRPGGEKGVLVFQIDPERIGKHLTRTDQQRRSAATRILGDGYRIVGEAPWIEAMTEADSVDLEIRARGLREGPGKTILERPGRRVQLAWQPGTFEGIQWVVVSEVDLEEVQAAGASEERAWMVVTLFLWLAWGVLTLGRPRPKAMGRHRI